jgi:hypothetical protein
VIRDPLYQGENEGRRLAKDSRVAALLRRLQWLKLASGLVALGIIGAIWVTWRW